MKRMISIVLIAGLLLVIIMPGLSASPMYISTGEALTIYESADVRGNGAAAVDARRGF